MLTIIASIKYAILAKRPNWEGETSSSMPTKQMHMHTITATVHNARKTYAPARAESSCNILNKKVAQSATINKRRSFLGLFAIPKRLSIVGTTSPVINIYPLYRKTGVNFLSGIIYKLFIKQHPAYMLKGFHHSKYNQ